MQDALSDFVHILDPLAAGALLPIAAWIFVSGLDDLVVLLAFLRQWATAPAPPSWHDVARAKESRIAIFVPCWQEAEVIGEMVTHNRSAIRYVNYDIFIGAYPNDKGTLGVVRDLEARFSNVHLCLCPHDGPTSKADCLNWIFQRMLLFEEKHGQDFEVVVTHDAEDLVHADELHWINYYSKSYDMVQTPVLPLPTPINEFTHGLYCDDFAEAHTRDLVARMAMGGFLPSCGVGTGFTRRALEELAASEANRVFDPSCLTEDYENGLRIHALGLRQIFLPIRFRSGAPMATREYFPRKFTMAVRQRTRWVTGIALQTWKRHGWMEWGRQWYWLWRDRKGLAGAPVSSAANLLFLYGVASWAWSAASGHSWGLGEVMSQALLWPVLAINAVLQVGHLTVRGVCVARVYGVGFALGVPLRAVYGNWLNMVATLNALCTFVRAEIRRQPLVWVKTDHAYPRRVALLPHKLPLEEILIGSAYLSAEQVMHAVATKPPGLLLARHLVDCGLLSEAEAYEALSIQLGMSLGRVEPEEVSRNVARSLPVSIVQRRRVLPIRIEEGRLYLATPESPCEEVHAELRDFTALEVCIQLVTPTNFQALEEALL